MKKMQYLPTDLRVGALDLVPKRRAPVCVRCGRTLWVPVPLYFRQTYKAPKRNEEGEALGYVPDFSHDSEGEIICYNHTLCRKRAAERKPNE